jgi:hypothetical protein
MGHTTGHQNGTNSNRQGTIHDSARGGRLAKLLAALGACWLTLGCQSEPAVQAPLSATVTDPSAEKLHEICEQLLIHYALSQSLPPSLEALRDAKAGDTLSLVSPVSGRPYAYFAKPLFLKGRTNRLLVCDADVAKATVRGRPARWVVLVTEPDPDSDPGGPLTTQVVLMAQSELDAALSADK